MVVSGSTEFGTKVCRIQRHPCPYTRPLTPVGVGTVSVRPIGVRVGRAEPSGTDDGSPRSYGPGTCSPFHRRNLWDEDLGRDSETGETPGSVRTSQRSETTRTPRPVESRIDRRGLDARTHSQRPPQDRWIPWAPSVSSSPHPTPCGTPWRCRFLQTTNRSGGRTPPGPSVGVLDASLPCPGSTLPAPPLPHTGTYWSTTSHCTTSDGGTTPGVGGQWVVPPTETHSVPSRYRTPRHLHRPEEASRGVSYPSRPSTTGSHQNPLPVPLRDIDSGTTGTWTRPGPIAGYM